MALTKRKATGERRLEIVQAARDILISEGFHKLTLRNIAKKVGINLSSLQYHFKNRAALIDIEKNTGTKICIQWPVILVCT